MRKLLSLALVMMLVLTSVFSGFSVFAEEAAADVITETSWEEDYGIKVDESIYPGFYLGDSYQIWDTENPNYATARTPVDGIKFMRFDANKDTEYTYTYTKNHRKYAPSVAVNAGRTGGTGDNALVFGMPVSYTNGYILFRNRNKAGGIVCGNATWDISFDIKLVAGEVSKIYSNFRVYSPSLNHYADCEEDKSTSVNISGTTEGYSGADISADKWTNLKFTATITGQNNFFFINIQAPTENGAIVLIDNLKICDEDGTNYLTSTNFAPVNYSTVDGERVSSSPYADEYEAGTLYIGEEFGNFNSSTFVNRTAWSDYGYYVDESIVPGYYLGSNNDYWTNATEGAGANIEGIKTFYYANSDSGSTYGNTTVRYKYAPSVAIGAGKTGRGDDNALIFGLPVDVNQYALLFYVQNDGSWVYTANKYQISFDIKSVAGTCEGIYSSLSTWAPGNGATTGDNATTYNNKYDEETGTYGTDGYTQDDISTTEWTTLTYYVDFTNKARYFWINIMPADENGAVVLIDNIVIQKADGENMFVSDNIMIAAKDNTLAYDTENDKQKYSLIQYHCGTFDYADAKTVDNTVDENVTYIPVSAIGQATATVAPTLSEAGEGVKGSYAINVPVNDSGTNTVKFKAYNPTAVDTIHQDDLYMFEFKARVTAGTVDNLKVAIATNGWKDNTSFKHNMQVFHNGSTTNEETGVTTYAHKGYTQTYLKVDGEELSSEWQSFRFYATTNCYDNVYRHLVFTLTGTDSSTVIQLDDIKGYTVADSTLTPIWVWGACDPNGSSFDLAEVSAYAVSDIGDGEYVITVPEAGVTAADFIANMNFNAEFKWGYANNKEMYSDDNLMAETDVIGTGDVLNLIGTTNSESATYPTGSLYQAFTVVVANDVNGDAAVDLRDVVRAKKLSVGAEETTALHLIALNAVENEDGITATDVATLRDIFMQ